MGFNKYPIHHGITIMVIVINVIVTMVIVINVIVMAHKEPFCKL